MHLSHAWVRSARVSKRQSVCLSETGLHESAARVEHCIGQSCCEAAPHFKDGLSHILHVSYTQFTQLVILVISKVNDL